MQQFKHFHWFFFFHCGSVNYDMRKSRKRKFKAKAVKKEERKI